MFDGIDQSLMSTEEEFDFSGDSVVNVVEGVWTITEASSEDVESENGKGTRHILEFRSDVLPFPITIRQWVKYDSKVGKDNAWVTRSRGVLKNIAKAALGEPKYTLATIVGARVHATTKDDGQGFYTLSKFRAVQTEGVGV